MKLIQSLFFIILLVAGVIFITELISVNDEYFIMDTFERTGLSQNSKNTSSELIDMVMINIPFTSKDSSGMKVWVFFILVLTFGLILGFLISLINIFTQRRQIMSQRYELKKLKSELDTLRNQNIDENLVLSDDFENENSIID
jgi:phosphotransferase system  glucose/maltose/N-acetylglucosamine-specific IIC component